MLNNSELGALSTVWNSHYINEIFFASLFGSLSNKVDEELFQDQATKRVAWSFFFGFGS